MPSIDDTVVIVGSGVAGSALATILARVGYHVTVIERSMAVPDRMQGEILLPGGIKALGELGLKDCLSNTEGMYFRGVIICDTQTGRTLPVPFPDPGITFDNGIFVDCLRKEAKAENRCTYIEASVLDVIQENGVVRGVVYNRKGEDTREELRAKLTVVCDGSFSSLRKNNVMGKPQKDGTWVSFRFNGSLPPEKSFLSDDEKADGIYYHLKYFTPTNSIFFYHVNKNSSRCIVNINCTSEWPNNLTEFLEHEINALPDDVRKPVLASIDETKIYIAHTFSFTSEVKFQPGLLTLGDALNIRHPVSGAGMSIAFRDIILWRKLLQTISSLDDFEAMRAAHKEFLSKRKEYTFVCDVNAKLFRDTCYTSDNSGKFGQSCMIDYLLWSEKAAKKQGEIVSLMDTRPHAFMYQVVASTLFTASCYVRHAGWWSLPRGLFNGAHFIYKTVATLVPYMRQEM